MHYQTCLKYIFMVQEMKYIIMRTNKSCFLVACLNKQLFLNISKIKSLTLATTVRFTSMNPRKFRESIFLIASENIWATE